MIIAGVMDLVAQHCVKYRPTSPVLGQACLRLQRLSKRFTVLLAKVREGRLPARRAPRRRSPAKPPADALPAEAASGPSVPRPRFPRGFGWLLAMVPHHDLRGRRAQLELWLADPELPALLEAAPQAGRMLRALCHILGVEPPPLLALPPRKRAPRGRGSSPHPGPLPKGEGEMRAAPALPVAREGRGEGRAGASPKPTLAAILPEPCALRWASRRTIRCPTLSPGSGPGSGRPEGAGANACP